MWELSICSKTISFSPRGQMGIGICLLHCLFLVLIKSSRSCFGRWVPVYVVLGSWRVWVVKPVVFVSLTFPDIQEGREDMRLIRVNEAVSRTCCSEALLSFIHVSAAAKERTPGAPWCSPRVSALSVQITAVCPCRVDPGSAAPAFTEPLRRGKQIMLASTQRVLGGESLMKSRKCAVLTGCSECDGDAEKQSKAGNRH